MTAHPMDTEALRREMEDLAGDALARDSRWAGTVSPVEALAILGLLAAAEHRATRAEAQSETRRIDIEYWQGVARGNAIAADVWKESAEDAEARIKDVLDRHAHYGLVEADDLRRALDGDT